MRGITLPSGRKIIASDTVGFISDLPTQLVAAFRATLEEVISADLIVHVRDIAHPDSDAQRDDVLDVLGELGVAGEAALDRGEGEDTPPPILEAWNKLDLLDAEAQALVGEQAARRDDVVILSALTGEGVETLQRTISDRMTRGAKVYGLRLPVADGAALAWLHEHGEVLSTTVEAEETRVDVRLSDAAFARFTKRGEG
jgi:GTP-binding protein HflX